MKRTKHFEQRIRQRSISELEIDYVRMHGENYANGRIVLSRKKAEKLMQEIEREYRKKKNCLEGICRKKGILVVEENNTLITAYPLLKINLHKKLYPER